MKHIPFSPTTLADFFRICERNVDKLLDVDDAASESAKERARKEAVKYLEPITKSIRGAQNARNKREKDAKKKREADTREERDEDTGEPERKRRKLEGDELNARLTSNMDLFRKAFPNIERIKSRAKFKTFLRTDGVACSVVYERKVPGTRASRKEARRRRETSNLRVLLSSRARVNASEKKLRFFSFKIEDFKFGIDPGRRDMIVAVEHASGEVLKISTRTHAHECGRAKAKRLTLKTLRAVVIPSTGLNLLQTLSKSPPSFPKDALGAVFVLYPTAPGRPRESLSPTSHTASSLRELHEEGQIAGYPLQ